MKQTRAAQVRDSHQHVGRPKNHDHISPVSEIYGQVEHSTLLCLGQGRQGKERRDQQEKGAQIVLPSKVTKKISHRIFGLNMGSGAGTGSLRLGLCTAGTARDNEMPPPSSGLALILGFRGQFADLAAFFFCEFHFIGLRVAN